MPDRANASSHTASLDASLPSHWMHALILLPVAWFAFFHNLDVSLFEGSEGLYAHIAHEMVERGEYIHLTYLGAPYVNKSPFFFWVLALFTTLFGETEAALRLPGALFSVGTMALTYRLGVLLFSTRAALWAALTVATTHVFLWYGRRVLFDSMLTFFMTLALLWWARAYFQQAGHRWYVLSFIPMALATITKGLHGLALPLLVILSFLLLMRDISPLKTRAFWSGLLLSGTIIGTYAFWVDLSLKSHPLLGQSSVISLNAPSGGHPLYWYLGVMWFDFFPWSAMIPAGLLWLWAGDPVTAWGPRLFVLAWFVGMLVMFSLSPLKRETYLIPMLPALGLLVGYAADRAWSASQENRTAVRLLCVALGLLGLVYVAAVTFGPHLLHRKLGVPVTLFPLWFVVIMVGLALPFLYAAIRMDARLALATLAISSLVFTGGVVGLILPAIDRSESPRTASREIKTLAQQNAEPLYLYVDGWPNNEDVVYYLSIEPALPQIHAPASLLAAVRASDEVLLLVDRPAWNRLNQEGDLALTKLQEFEQVRKKNLFLVSARWVDPRSGGQEAPGQ